MLLLLALLRHCRGTRMGGGLAVAGVDSGQQLPLEPTVRLLHLIGAGRLASIELITVVLHRLS